MNVTMPHKQRCFAAVDELDPAAEALGAVNCVVAPSATVGSRGHNTDGAGFVDSLPTRRRFDPRGGPDRGARRRRRGPGDHRRARPGPARPGDRGQPIARSPPPMRPGSPVDAGAVGRPGRDRCSRPRGQRHLGRDGERHRRARSTPTSCDPASSSPTSSTTRCAPACWPRPRPAAPRPSTGSACWCTRRPAQSSCGPASGPSHAPMRAAAGRAGRATADRAPPAGRLTRCCATSPPANPTARPSSSSSKASRPDCRSPSRTSRASSARRRLGYGRGPRQRFEADEVTLLGGVRHGRTLGSPVAIEIKNTEWFRSDRWHEEMSPAPGATKDPLDPAPPGPRRPRRHAEVRLRRRPRRARAGERPRDRSPGRRRVPCQDSSWPRSGVQILSHVIQMGSARCKAVDPPDTGGPRHRRRINPVRCFDASRRARR